MSDLVFVDCETLGLDPDAPIWEFAAVRRIQDRMWRRFQASFPDSVGAQIAAHFTIQHDPTGWLDGIPQEFRADYHGRFDETTAWCERTAASEIHRITNGAIIVGSNPGFDIERIEKLLRRNGIEPGWHYHPLDIASIAIGYLAARGELIPQPWKSDRLSTAVGVDLAKFARHTAMGDVLWTQAQWDAVIAAQPDLAANQ